MHCRTSLRSRQFLLPDLDRILPIMLRHDDDEPLHSILPGPTCTRTVRGIGFRLLVHACNGGLIDILHNPQEPGSRHCCDRKCDRGNYLSVSLPLSASTSRVSLVDPNHRLYHAFHLHHHPQRHACSSSSIHQKQNLCRHLDLCESDAYALFAEHVHGLHWRFHPVLLHIQHGSSNDWLFADNSSYTPPGHEWDINYRTSRPWSSSGQSWSSQRSRHVRYH